MKNFLKEYVRGYSILGNQSNQVTPENLDLAREFFDTVFYANQLAAKQISVGRGKDSGLLHYLSSGWKMGLDPSEKFSTRLYLNVHDDVALTGLQPLLHYMAFGRAEGRIARKATGAEYRLAESIVDPEFYKNCYRDLLKDEIDPVQHFFLFGWREGRNPNPFTHLPFVKKMAPNSFGDFVQLSEHLNKTIWLNALMSKPTALKDIRIALVKGDAALDELFCFDVAKYSAKQEDVLRQSPFHPVEHLFYDGLSQNRLRNGLHLNRDLVPIELYDNDYDLMLDQSRPLKAVNFNNLSLAPDAATIDHDLSVFSVGIGVVLYDNTYDEIQRLIHSVGANIRAKTFSGQLHIWDNSPKAMDLSWVEQMCEDIDVIITRHPENPGFALGHNGLMSKCFNAGNSHYLGLNPDGYLLPDAVENVLKFAAEKTGPSLIELGCEPLTHPKWYHPVTGETEWVSGAAFLLDIETYMRTEGFDPEFPMYCEDTDLSFRAYQAGVGLYVAPQARYYHDTSQRMYTTEKWRTARMMTGTWYLLQKWGYASRAELVRTEMLRQGFDESVLQMPEKIVDTVNPHIDKMMEKDRFARSRFWRA